MALKSLNQLRKLRNALIESRKAWLTIRHGIHFGRDVSVSLSASFDGVGRGALTVGSETLIAFKTNFVTFDREAGSHRPIRIGSRCFVGGGSVLMPGITIGDESIVGAGAVVFEDVPPRSIAAGNPARIVRSEIEVGPFGRLKGADENSRRMYDEG